jgi:UDP-3-O-[3-hydroxymyristoyl] glucosamine N-acyltransferase
MITAMVEISGSSIIGKNVWIAPGAKINNGIIVDDNVFIGIGSVVIRNVSKNKVVFGIPAKEIRDRE